MNSSPERRKFQTLGAALGQQGAKPQLRLFSFFGYHTEMR
jgi:hypothetical protein